MKKLLSLFLLVFCGVMSTLAFPQAAKDTSKSDVSAQQSKAVIEGLVRDIACPSEWAGFCLAEPVGSTWARLTQQHLNSDRSQGRFEASS